MQKQDRHCTYTVTSSGVRATILQWKSISITYSECVFVALGTECARRVGHFVICGLSRSTVFFHIISQMVRLKKKTSYWA